jgi:hypothetical protein
MASVPMPGDEPAADVSMPPGFGMHMGRIMGRMTHYGPGIPGMP